MQKKYTQLDLLLIHVQSNIGLTSFILNSWSQQTASRFSPLLGLFFTKVDYEHHYYSRCLFGVHLPSLLWNVIDKHFHFLIRGKIDSISIGISFGPFVWVSVSLDLDWSSRVLGFGKTKNDNKLFGKLKKIFDTFRHNLIIIYYLSLVLNWIIFNVVEYVFLLLLCLQCVQ